MLSKTTITLMVGTAIFFDVSIWLIALLHLIPIGFTNVLAEILNTFVNGAASLLFFMWFTWKGMRIITPKKMITMCGGTFAGLTPILGTLLPVQTLSVLFTIYFDKIEHKIKETTSVSIPTGAKTLPTGK